MTNFAPNIFLTMIYNRCHADAALSALIEGVYSYVPDHTSLPYIHLSIEEAKPISALSISANEIVLSVKCYTRGASPKENNTILTRVFELLQDYSTTADGHKIANMKWLAHESALLRDGDTFEGNMLFRAILEEVSV